MKALSVVQADAVYLSSSNPRIEIQGVEYAELGRFSNALYRFDSSLGNMGRDSYWGPAIRMLKILRFDLCAAPHSVQELVGRCEALLKWLKEYLGPSTEMYPGIAEGATSVTRWLEAVSVNRRAPLLEKLCELSSRRGEGPIGILISEPRLVQMAQDAVKPYSELRACEVISPRNLRREATYETIFAIGPPQWFPEYVFSAPRSNAISIVTYSWMRVKWKPPEVFVAPLVASVSADEIILNRVEDEQEQVDPELIVPTIDFSSIFVKATDRGQADDDEEIVEARAYLLDQAWAVLLEANESSSVLIIDPDEGSTDRVRRVPTSEIERGTYVLLRTNGGGDYIVPVANRLLAEYASTARTHQKEWKARLRALYRQHGPGYVSSHLARHGSVRANDANIRNWMSERNIKTHDAADFKAIMRFVGLGDQAEEYWNVMGTIGRAHSKAGFRIRKLLLDEVDRIDLRDLERLGMMTIELPDKDAGSLGIFRVQFVSQTTEHVAASNIGEPFKIEEYGKDLPSQGLLWD